VLEPVLYFSGAILGVIIVKLLHAAVLPTAIGAIGIVVLAISQQWKFKPGVIISIACLLIMALIFNKNWVEDYFIRFLYPGDVHKPMVFGSGFTASLIPVILAWVYQQQLNSIHVRSAQKWFNKKISVKFFKLLFYFQLFLLLFFTIAFLMLSTVKTSALSINDTILIAGGLALLAAGIPAIIFITKGSAGSRSHRRHHRTHRNHGNEFPKNTEPS
jgi:hypothetical protein